MASKPLSSDLVVSRKGTDPEIKTVDAPSTLSASDEVRAKLSARQLTEQDMTSAVDWARAQAPTT